MQAKGYCLKAYHKGLIKGFIGLVWQEIFFLIELSYHTKMESGIRYDAAEWYDARLSREVFGVFFPDICTIDGD